MRIHNVHSRELVAPVDAWDLVADAVEGGLIRLRRNRLVSA
jgi:hypothetical protein